MQDMGISVVMVSSSGKGQPITSRDGEPNWSYILSAAKTNRTQTEFVEKIKELARKAAMTTNAAEKEVIERQVLQLRTEYLLDVAPDRKSMYQSAKML